jgi:hypothetical protein
MRRMPSRCEALGKTVIVVAANTQPVAAGGLTTDDQLRSYILTLALCVLMMCNTGSMKRPVLLVVLLLAVGLTATALALRSREGNPQFVAQQQGLRPVSGAALGQLILTTSDPRPGYGGRARGAHCVSAHPSALGNPWTCVVRYPRLPRVRFAVDVHANRSISGVGDLEGASGGTPLSVSGCCVLAP